MRRSLSRDVPFVWQYSISSAPLRGNYCRTRAQQKPSPSCCSRRRHFPRMLAKRASICSRGACSLLASYNSAGDLVALKFYQCLALFYPIPISYEGCVACKNCAVSRICCASDINAPRNCSRSRSHPETLEAVLRLAETAEAGPPRERAEKLVESLAVRFLPRSIFTAAGICLLSPV